MKSMKRKLSSVLLDIDVLSTTSRAVRLSAVVWRNQYHQQCVSVMRELKWWLWGKKEATVSNVSSSCRCCCLGLNCWLYNMLPYTCPGDGVITEIYCLPNYPLKKILGVKGCEVIYVWTSMCKAAPHPAPGCVLKAFDYTVIGWVSGVCVINLETANRPYQEVTCV